MEDRIAMTEDTLDDHRPGHEPKTRNAKIGASLIVLAVLLNAFWVTGMVWLLVRTLYPGLRGIL